MAPPLPQPPSPSSSSAVSSPRRPLHCPKVLHASYDVYGSGVGLESSEGLCTPSRQFTTADGGGYATNGQRGPRATATSAASVAGANNSICSNGAASKGYLAPIGHQREVYPYAPSPNTIASARRRKAHGFDSSAYWEASRRRRGAEGYGNGEGNVGAHAEEGPSGDEAAHHLTTGGSLPPVRSPRHAPSSSGKGGDDEGGRSGKGLGSSSNSTSDARWAAARFMEGHATLAIVRGGAPYPSGPWVSPRSAHGLYVHHQPVPPPPPQRHQPTGSSPSPRRRIATAESEKEREPLTSASEGVDAPKKDGAAEEEDDNAEGGGADGDRAAAQSAAPSAEGPADGEPTSDASAPKEEAPVGMGALLAGDAGSSRASSSRANSSSSNSIVNKSDSARSPTPSRGTDSLGAEEPPLCPNSGNEADTEPPRDDGGGAKPNAQEAPQRGSSTTSMAQSGKSTNTPRKPSSSPNNATERSIVAPEHRRALLALRPFDAAHSPPRPPPILEPADPLRIIHGRGFALPEVRPTDSARYASKYRAGEPTRLASSRPVGHIGEFRRAWAKCIM